MRTLTATAVLAAAAAALTGCGNVSFGVKGETRSYTAPSNVTALNINGRGGEVEVTTSGTSVIKVRERLRWSNDKNEPKVRHVTENDTLTLSSECASVTFGGAMCGVSYRVEVPRDMPVSIDNQDGRIVASGLAGKVKLHSANGSIKVDDVRATSLDLSTRDGSIRVSGRATTVTLDSANGSITAGLTADRLTAGSRDGRIRLGGRVKTADLDTANGAVHATGLTAERLTARSRDGGIMLGFVSPPMSVRAETANGSIRLSLPPAEGYAIDASARNGGERIDPLLRQDSASPRRIRLDTSDGAITVNAADQRTW
ncbi:MAG: DUF4097 domain-containing protein [Actinomadura sp.]